MSGSSLLVAVNARTLKRPRLPEALPPAEPPRPATGRGLLAAEATHDPPWPASCVTELALTVNRGRSSPHGILRGLYAATGDDHGVASQRVGAVERAVLVLTDVKQALEALAAAQPGVRRPLRQPHQRQRNRLSDVQARAAVAAALLHQLWVVCVNRIPWELAVASGTMAMLAEHLDGVIGVDPTATP